MLLCAAVNALESLRRLREIHQSGRAYSSAQLEGPDGNVPPGQVRWLVLWSSRSPKWHIDPRRLAQTATLDKKHVDFLIGTRRRYGWCLSGHYGDGWLAHRHAIIHRRAASNQLAIRQRGKAGAAYLNVRAATPARDHGLIGLFIVSNLPSLLVSSFAVPQPLMFSPRPRWGCVPRCVPAKPGDGDEWGRDQSDVSINAQVMKTEGPIPVYILIGATVLGEV